MTSRGGGGPDPRGRTFCRQPHHRARGAVGEEEARRWLMARGYRVVARNVTCRGGELDLVAVDEAGASGAGVLCFVEIKARSSDTYGRAVESVTATKKRRIIRAARHWLLQHPTDLDCRFDVLAMDLVDGAWNFELVRDAFRVG